MNLHTLMHILTSENPLLGKLDFILSPVCVREAENLIGSYSGVCASASPRRCVTPALSTRLRQDEPRRSSPASPALAGFVRKNCTLVTANDIELFVGIELRARSLPHR